jgi:hypothetical protein
MRENRLYGSEGGGAVSRSPYPYHDAGAMLVLPLGPLVHTNDISSVVKRPR